MIHKLEIAGVHMNVGEDLKKHVLKKIGRLDKYILKRARVSVHAEVKLKEGKTKGKVIHTGEVVLHLPNEVITVQGTAGNIFTAVNQVEEKLKLRLGRYKEQQSGPKLRQHLLARTRRRGFVEL
jgi:ribosomal subunit interface protein